MCTPGFMWDTCQSVSKREYYRFFFLQACITTETKREGKNIKNIILHTVVNLLFVIVFGRWLFIDHRGEIKHQEQIKHNRDLFYVVLWWFHLDSSLVHAAPTNPSRVNILIQLYTQLTLLNLKLCQLTLIRVLVDCIRVSRKSWHVLAK